MPAASPSAAAAVGAGGVRVQVGLGRRRRRPSLPGQGGGGRQKPPASSGRGRGRSPTAASNANANGHAGAEMRDDSAAATATLGGGHGTGTGTHHAGIEMAEAKKQAGAEAEAKAKEKEQAAEAAAQEEAQAGCGGMTSIVGDNLVISVLSGSACVGSGSGGGTPTAKTTNTTNTASAAAGAAADATANGANDGRRQSSAAGSSSSPNTKTSSKKKKKNGPLVVAGRSMERGQKRQRQSRAQGPITITTITKQQEEVEREAQEEEEQQQQNDEEVEDLFDWVGSSIQSACDNMCPTPGMTTAAATAEDANGEIVHTNASPIATNGATPLAASTTQDGEPSSVRASKVQYLTSGAKSPVSFAAVASAASSSPTSTTRARAATGAAQSTPTAGGEPSSSKVQYLTSGAKSPVSFAAVASAASSSPTSTTKASATSAATADTALPVPLDATDSDLSLSPPAVRTAPRRGYGRAQTAPPPTTTTPELPTVEAAASLDSTDGGGRRRGNRKAPSSSSSSSRILQYRSSTSLRESIASLKTSRSRSDRGAEEQGGVAEMAATASIPPPSPSKTASFDAASAGSRDEQDSSSGSGLRLASLRPPLGPRLGHRGDKKEEGGGGTASWTAMHDKLIDELFEESRRQYIATHFSGEDGQKIGHHHYDYDYEHDHDHDHEKDRDHKEHSGWKLGNLLSGCGGSGGGGNNADGDGAKSKRSKEDRTSADAGNSGGFRLPWNSHTETKTKRRRRKRLKVFRRKKKEAAPASMVGVIGASITSALAAAAAVAAGSGGTRAKENGTSSPPAKGKQGKAQRSLADAQRSVTFAKGTAAPSRSIFRATGEYTGRPNPDPGTYLHPTCRLQKDRGCGEVPGKAICALSRENALGKLRQKVDVIIEVEQSSAASTKAKLKLKQAVLNTRAGNEGTIETRSVIGVKMGFLSMKYGILLRWNAKTGLVNLIVLRKMCPSGFLTGDDGNAVSGAATKPSIGASAKAIPVPAAPSPSRRPKKSIKESSPSKHGFILGRLVDGANAILHGKGWDSGAASMGTEVAHLGPPYLVQRPKSFADSTLSVAVLRTEDLCAGDGRGSDWVVIPYIRLSIGAQTHRTRTLKKMTTSPTWTPKHGDNNCRFAVSNNPRDDDQHLKVEVYDWRPLRRDRILGVVFVPVASVEPQKSTQGGASPVSTEVTIPVRMIRNKEGPYGSVTLSLVHQNDHLVWLKQELKARGR